jgi:hypothetical protein
MTEYVCVDIKGNLCISQNQKVAEEFIKRFSEDGRYALIKCSAKEKSNCIETLPLNTPKFKVELIRNRVENKVGPIVKGWVKREDAGVHLLTHENHKEVHQVLISAA